MQLIPDNQLRMGLGCSRLGSVGGSGPQESLALLGQALDGGVRVFDTSNIYGQGDSERLLGLAVRGRDDCLIISKGGKFHSWQRRLVMPAKPLMRFLARRSNSIGSGIRQARAEPMPARWTGEHLIRSMHGSLRRLGRDRIDLFLLHGPHEQVVRSRGVVDALELAKRAGDIGMIGVSVDDVPTARACLDDSRIQVVQVPLRPGNTEFEQVVSDLAAHGVIIVAREIFGGQHALAAAPDPSAFADRRIGEVLRDPRVSVGLVGVTRRQTLAASIGAARAFQGLA